MVGVAEGTRALTELTSNKTNPLPFLHTTGAGRRIVHLPPAETLFRQGELSTAVFYIHKGRVKLTVTSLGGREATIGLFSTSDFVGEEAITPSAGPRGATATTITACTVLEIAREHVIRAVHADHAFSEMILSFVLSRNMRTQADLIDHLFNSSEKRLARALLLMADITGSEEAITLIPAITQESLSEIVGTTRSRINFFMNRFRTLGYIEYGRRIRVHKSLLNVVLRG
jgi:CRP/FNR family transcriptional regulator, cyclic AMP receptor protein